jgi:class 3 adenylate cyclase/tetratricopeptide (TPR) repeat protein
MQQIADWLKTLGMSEYAQRFAENDIDIAVLPHLTDQHLKDLGVSLGHRLKMLHAVAQLAGAAPATPQPAPVTEPKSQDTAERRQVTVMFSDLVGSTALSARMDPEDLREVISAYQKCVAETVRRFDGFVAKYMGDGVLIYFGYPQAHEDDAAQAVRAGLELIGAVSSLKHDASLQTRVGIATGLVVVGDLIGSGEAQERGIVGETPNLAARLQGIAEPNMVVIADGTRRLLGNLFELEDLGAKDLKGIAGPMRVFAALRASSAEGHFEALHTTGLTALVGREEELELLLRRWSKAKTGEGQVVLLSGEGGIGKSRLTAALLEHLATEPHTRLRYFCSPHHRDSALYPAITQLERAAGFRRDDTADQRLDKLKAVLSQGTNDLREVVPLIADLLSISTGDRYPPIDLKPQKRKERTLAALISQVEGLSAKEPVLMVFEDVHWSDATTRESLDLLIDGVPRLRVLVIITFRPEFTPSWVGRSHVTLLALNRLPPRQRAVMIAQVTGGKALPKEITDQIIDRTDGVPLFIEELTKSVVDSGGVIEAGDRYAVTGSALAIPTTLQASLLARLDRLASAREVAQIGAALGRSFSHELISAVANIPQPLLDDALEELVRAELIFRRGTPPEAEYTFKHALVQDAAYATLLHSRRRELHARVADTLERARVVDRAAVRPEILAYHLAQTPETERAVAYLREAAQVAAERWANAEAVQHLSRARELSSKLDDGQAKRKLELAILLELGPMLQRVEGFLSASVEEVYTLARSLCAEGDNAGQRFAASWGLWSVAQFQSRLDRARQLAEELIGLGEASQDPGLLLQAHHSAWTTLFGLGDDCTALRHAEEGINLYDIHEHRTHSSRYGGHDPGVCARMVGGLAAWFAGFSDRAGVLSAEAIGLGRTLGDPFSYAMALSFGSSVALMRREPEIVEERCAAMQRLLDDHQLGLGHFGSTAKILRGWAAAVTGRPDKGCELAKEGLSETRRSGYARFSFQLGIMAEVLHLTGDFPAALDVIEEAIQVAEETGERRWLPRLLHDKAHSLMAATGGVSAAEDALKNSVLVARQQQARSAELRAATSLARLWRDQGKREEARDLLAPVYGWFTEGFDTLDLKEAKALLDELRA